ncbi:MAG: hypothetical protein B7Z20_04580 [Sphingobium sp. 32-64-5]|nr:MAG: hypothetical protein B7Z20_04580 [Sphingobium sp. 32-64-5]
MLEILASTAAAADPSSLASIWSHIVADFSNIGSPSAMSAFIQVLMIDILLAGDNAIVVGALAAGLPEAQRRRVIIIGIVAALVLRIAFALVVSELMQIVGLIFAGGLLLLWVSWKMYRELRHDASNVSLDNVLAVAGAAREHPGILIVGLVLSVMLMGVAANIIAKYIERYRWIAYFGLIVILYVAGSMIYEGITDHQVGILTLF